MKDLYIDIETYSSVDISKSGSYKYAESEDFEVLLFAYKADDEPTKVVDLANEEKIPEDIIKALGDSNITKHAYNAAFEWYCLGGAGYNTDLKQWQCTMIHAMYCGYPSGLAATGKALGIAEDKQKLATGKALIKYFCSPCKATKANGGRKRNLPKHDPEKWKLFMEYNRQDVEAEYAIEQKLHAFPVPDIEWHYWTTDVVMNAIGISIDQRLVDGAIAIDEESNATLLAKAKALTGLANPKSNKQMLEWLQGKGVEVDNARKETITSLLEDESIAPEIKEVLRVKQKLGKTSTKKYVAMKEAVTEEGKVKGLLQFYGANRTGRWAGRLVQVQNLPRNYLTTLDEARRLACRRDYQGLNAVYGNAPDTLSQLIRTAFVPSEGNKLIVSDFSAIEARVIAWLAGEEWVLDVFRNGGDIYCATASQMFGVPVEKNGINGELRQKGKVATLALGYQGGENALIQMGALDMGIPENDLPDIKMKWRAANQNIVKMWSDINQAAIETILDGTDHNLYHVTFRLEADVIHGSRYFTVELPSGRKLFYVNPYLGENRFGGSSIHFSGLNQTTKKWEDQETYGGKLVENIVQAIARDCLAITIDRVQKVGYSPVMHIHDEIVIDASKDQHLEDVNAIFAEPMPWAPGLPLSGAGFEASYYMKD